tara:strand:+ start:24 stop:236 length:213 start_codon:yes stop_codon:yes gene_type:complete
MRKWFDRLYKKQKIELYRTISWSAGSLGAGIGGANASGIGLATTVSAIFAIIIFIIFRVFRILNIKHPFQ